MKKYTKKASKTSKQISRNFKKYLSQGERFATRRPLISVAIMIALLFSLIVVNQLLRTPEDEVATEQMIKQVEVFSIGQVPRIEVLAEVEKTGVITIVAQTPGIVSNIAVEPGAVVGRGTNVASLASNYYGGNALSVQRQLAKAQLDNVEESYDLNIEVIQKQKELAELSETNEAELRELSAQSIEETKDLISLNEQIIERFDETINTSTISAEIAAAQQAKSQYFSSLIQLRQALRNTEYQTDEQNPPADLSQSQRDLTVKQLELQAKALELNKEVSQLQYKLARVNEAQMYPATPFSGEIERVHVREGEYVNPGTPLVTMYCDQLATRLVAKVSPDTATQLSKLEPAVISLGNTLIELYPDFVSSVATDGSLHSVYFSLPPESAQLVTDQARVVISLPIGSVDASGAVPFIPIDAVHQSEQVSEVYLVKNDQVVAQVVQLGIVQGGFVEVIAGVGSGDQIVMDRTVIKGQQVQPISSS